MFKQIGHRLRTWKGRVGPKEYLYVGLSLSVVKILCDYATVTILFGRQWSWLAYLTSRFSLLTRPYVASLSGSSRNQFLVMALVAAPFMYIGVLYTVKRLRDACAPTWLAALFFVPFVKFILIALLCFLPSVEPGSEEVEERRPTWLGTFIPTGKFGSAVLGFLVAALISISAAYLITTYLGDYGWTLFLGLPFFSGFASAAIYCYHSP